MAMVTWGDLLKIAHDLTLALRAIERVLSDNANQEILARCSSETLLALRTAIHEGNLARVRQLIREQSVNTVGDLSLAALRRKASLLRIPNYNACTRIELIHKINAFESAIQRILREKPIKIICKDGFCDGAGI